MLNSADAAFVGHGPNGPVHIGVEIKSLADVVACITDGRFTGNQLPKLRDDYDCIWLLAYGRDGAGADGNFEIWRDGTRFSTGVASDAVRGWLLTVEIAGGCRVCRVENEDAAADWLAALHKWWSKPYDKHRSHRQMYQPHTPTDTSLMEMLASGRQSDTKTLVRRMAAQLPGVGWDRAVSIERHFGNDPALFSAALARAAKSDWDAIGGIGKKTAKKIADALGLGAARQGQAR